jgi:kinesin family protein 5
MGPPPQGGQIGVGTQRGLIPRVVGEVFAAVNEGSNDLSIKVSYVENYLDKLRDLLNPNAADLQVRQDPSRGVYVEGATEPLVRSPADLMKLMQEGFSNHATGCTRMNRDSSRSHCLFTIFLEGRHEGSSVVGQLTLVDLAGSELVKKSQAEGSTLDEAKAINRSLSALGNVIQALVTSSGHVPYRDSKLTRLLQESLGGNSKTSIIITASSSTYNAVETMSSLRFGVRAKKIKNRPHINQVRSCSV